MQEPEQDVAPLWKFFQGLIGFQHMIGLYPPYLGAGVRVSGIDPEYRWIETSMRHTIWNTNYVDKQFGGSLYAMCDPFYMFMLMNRLGEEYIVWDKAGRIDFLRPGEGEVRARFEVDDAEVEEIRRLVAEQRKCEREYTVTIRDSRDREIARVWKLLYIRRRPRKNKAKP